jgi:hypothetical protein
MLGNAGYAIASGPYWRGIFLISAITLFGAPSLRRAPGRLLARFDRSDCGGFFFNRCLFRDPFGRPAPGRLPSPFAFVASPIAEYGVCFPKRQVGLRS